MADGTAELTPAQLAAIRDADARPDRPGEESFRLPWELRSFALAVAFYETGDFAWTEFQARLVEAIAASAATDEPEQYYAHWTEALVGLLEQRGGIVPDELERRTQQILATPRDNTHQHAHYDPVVVPAGAQDPAEPAQLRGRDSGHGHDHEPGHEPGHESGHESGHDHH